MKAKHILFSTTPIIATTLVVAPVLTSCSNTITINLDNTTATWSTSETENLFGMSGNYKKGTNYEFVADVTKWNTDYGKPESETKWKEETNILFAISKLNLSEFNLLHTDNIKIICDGKELKKGTSEEVQAGTADWFYVHTVTSEYTDIQFIIAQKEGQPITYTSTIKLQNIQFAEDFENGIIAFGLVE